MIAKSEKKKYLFKEKRDIQIISLIHGLEKQRLSSYEKFLLLFIRTQLEKNWRKPLIQILQLMKKNSKKESTKRIREIQKFANTNFWKP